MKITKTTLWKASFTIGLVAFLSSAQAAELSNVAPTGKLRVGLVYAPSQSAFFVTRNSDNTAQGVTADLAAAYAKSLGVPVEEVLYPNSGAAADALAEGKVDVSFMPLDASRKKRFDAGPAYTYVESTYMVTSKSNAHTVADVDHSGIRILAIDNTTTFRAAQASLKHAKVTAVATVGEAVQALKDGRADAFALSRDSLPTYVAEVPGSRIVSDAFQRVPITILVQKGKTEQLTAATNFMNHAKSDALIRHALDKAGYQNQVVAQ